MIDKEKLTGQQSKYILIPYDIIIEKTVDKRRGLVYSYLYSKTGIDNTLLFK